MKKLMVMLLVFTVFISVAIAQDDTEISDELSGIDKAYQCLQNAIDQKDSSSLSLEEAAFSILALGSEEKLTSRIDNDASNNNCWPKSSCNLKNTAQVLLAFDRINRDTNDIESWLLSKESSSSELTWFVQIDVTNRDPATKPTKCSLSYKNSESIIQIQSDLTISGNPGNCFTISSSGYWLRVREQCLDETFQISCEEDFISNLLYQKQGSTTIYISPETHSAASSGTTEEKINSKCFKLSNSGGCDYEGSLWATLALNKKGKDISILIPYLLALSEDNKRLFPNSLIHSITSGDDQYSAVIQSQKQDQFWQAPSTKYNKFYDTALGILSLQSSSAPELENAKSYLLSVQTPNGCWNNNNIRDTAFLLYAGWPKEIKYDDGGLGFPPPQDCQVSGFFCESPITCDSSGGEIISDFSCPGFEVCCDTPIFEQSCFDKGGHLCSLSESCSGTDVPSSDGSCCLGVCEPKPEVSECESLGGSCQFSCNTNSEKETFDSCTLSGDVCCVVSIGGSDDFVSDKKDSNLTFWIILISIFIFILILAIIFRKKIGNLFRSNRRRPSTGGPLNRPSMPPPIMRVRRPPPRRRRLRPRSKADKEFQDTLDKLKNISK